MNENDDERVLESDAGDVNFKLTDELWEEMAGLEGAAIESIVVWDSSLVDDDLEEPVADESRTCVDFELYLANQTLLELYGAAVLLDEESEPLMGLDQIGDALSSLAEEGAYIDEISADQEDNLVLNLASEEGKSVLVFVTAWIESTWETLPEEEE